MEENNGCQNVLSAITGMGCIGIILMAVIFAVLWLMSIPTTGGQNGDDSYLFVAILFLILAAGLVLFYITFVVRGNMGVHDEQQWPSGGHWDRSKDPPQEEFDMPFPGMRSSDNGKSTFSGGFTVNGEEFGFDGKKKEQPRQEKKEEPKQQYYQPPPKFNWKAYDQPPPPPKASRSKTPNIDKAFDKFKSKMEAQKADSFKIIREAAKYHPQLHQGEPQYEEFMKRVTEYAADVKRSGNRK